MDYYRVPTDRLSIRLNCRPFVNLDALQPLMIRSQHGNASILKQVALSFNDFRDWLRVEIKEDPAMIYGANDMQIIKVGSARSISKIEVRFKRPFIENDFIKSCIKAACALQCQTGSLSGRQATGWQFAKYSIVGHLAEETFPLVGYGQYDIVGDGVAKMWSNFLEEGYTYASDQWLSSITDIPPRRFASLRTEKASLLFAHQTAELLTDNSCRNGYTPESFLNSYWRYDSDSSVHQLNS